LEIDMNHVQREAIGYNVEAPKKRLNVTVNEDLVRVVQTLTGNLSGTIEDLLADFVKAKRREKQDNEEHWKRVHACFNEFYEKYGSPGDDYLGDYLPEVGDR
jgi:antitoxin CcdA